MLGSETLVAFVWTSQPEAARTFFEETLGLAFGGDMGHALLFELDAGRIMVVKGESVTPPPGTSLGWQVGNLNDVVRRLAGRGVGFERFEGMQQDDMGIWRPGGGDAGVAWFKDPDGNLLSVSGPAASHSA